MTSQLESLKLLYGPMDGAEVSPRHVKDGWLVRTVGPQVFDAGGKVWPYYEWCTNLPTLEVTYRLNEDDVLVFHSVRPLQRDETTD